MALEPRLIASTQERLTARDVLKSLASLFKLRIVMLLLVSAVGGAFLGQGGVPSLRALVAILVTGTLAAGGASAVNQYLERDADALMRRTARRPLPAGQIARPALVLWIAVAMIVTAVVSVLPTRPVMALYLALGAVIYVGIYTIWLKPRSVLNIVIGGAAGSMAVMTGGAAVGAASDPGVIALALIVFLWTPAHFWALAMFYQDDYAEAGVPMLPVRTTNGHTAWWIFVHALSTALAALVLGAHPALGLLYVIPVGVVAALMVEGSVRLIRRPERKQAIKLFVLSNVFLLLVFVAVILATTARQLLT
jgi:protoheme IX farnesyltransferase